MTRDVPCPCCGQPRPIRGGSDNLSAAARRPCRPCSMRAVRARIDFQASRDWFVDPIVVERLMAGSPVHSNPAERRAATRKLHAYGLTASQIAERLRVTRRSVERILRTIREQQVAA